MDDSRILLFCDLFMGGQDDAVGDLSSYLGLVQILELSMERGHLVRPYADSATHVIALLQSPAAARFALYGRTGRPRSILSKFHESPFETELRFY